VLLVFGKNSFGKLFGQVSGAEKWLKTITGVSILPAGFGITLQQVYGSDNGFVSKLGWTISRPCRFISVITLLSWRGFAMITVTDCLFAQLEIGSTFLHLGIQYRKISHNSATLFDADVHDAIHRFHRDELVTLVDEDSDTEN
jgi:hypothetical protein